MVAYRSLTPTQRDQIIEAIRKIAPPSAGATRPHGIEDLGDGDTTWTDPDTGEERSVKDEAQRLETVRELVRVDGERLSQVIADAQALLDQVDGLGGVLAAARADLDSLGMGEAEAVEQVVAESGRSDDDELAKMIAKKRSKYPDEQKFMQYLARQGFGYDAIKSALATADEE